MSSSHPVNILMVDDQPAKLLSYETILADLQENLIRANSGKEALEILLKHDVAVVLVDVCMPELDGFELATMIRSHPRFRRTAIILVSGVFVEDMYRLKGYDSGAVDYVAVPIVPEILRAKVAVFAELFRKTVELESLNQELERRVAERTEEIARAAGRLRESEERLRLVLTAGGIQGWTWDLGTNEITWLTPLGMSESVVQSFADFTSRINGDDRLSMQSSLERAVSGTGEYVAEFRQIIDGEEQWILGRGTVLHDATGSPTSIAGININITRRKRAEQERVLLLRNAQEARLEAEQANQLKDEFLATLSHELRTPLNAITGWAHILRAESLDRKTQLKAIDTINRNALLQTQLISDILDVSRITSGKLRLDLKPVNLVSVIQAAIDTVRPAADAKNVTIHTRLCELEPVSGDPARLQQVVWNLLSNATKFAPMNGSVEVGVEKTESNVELTIQDDGPGIRPEFLPYVFEPFRQADSSSTRSHHGLGLGLSIVRHLVEMHGGRVSASNRTDRSGAVLKAAIPLQVRRTVEQVAMPGARSFAEPENASPSTPSLSGVRLVVVDDEPDSREITAMVLERNGAEVKIASSAIEAFTLLVRELPDVLIADIEMPQEDGYALVRKIRALPATQGGLTPAVALTAYASAQDRSRALEAGFNAHVAKPIQPARLIGLVARLCGRLASSAVPQS